MARMVLTFHVVILRGFLSLSVGLDPRATTRGPGWTGFRVMETPAACLLRLPIPTFAWLPPS